MNSNFPNRWSQASLTFNNYFYLFLYLYITWITINNNAPHLKSPKNQNRRAALGRPAIKITGGLQLVCDRPTLDQPSKLSFRRSLISSSSSGAKENTTSCSSSLRIHFANLLSLLWCVLSLQKSYSEFILSSLQLVLWLVAAIKRLSVHHHTADYIFSGALGSFWVSLKTESHWSRC